MSLIAAARQAHTALTTARRGIYSNFDSPTYVKVYLEKLFPGYEVSLRPGPDGNDPASQYWQVGDMLFRLFQTQDTVMAQLLAVVQNGTIVYCGWRDIVKTSIAWVGAEMALRPNLIYDAEAIGQIINQRLTGV